MRHPATLLFEVLVLLVRQKFLNTSWTLNRSFLKEISDYFFTFKAMLFPNSCPSMAFQNQFSFTLSSIAPELLLEQLFSWAFNSYSKLSARFLTWHFSLQQIVGSIFSCLGRVMCGDVSTLCGSILFLNKMVPSWCWALINPKLCSPLTLGFAF